MSIYLSLPGSFLASVLVYGLYKLLRVVREELTSPLRDFPGPKSHSFIYGNFKEIWEADNSVLHEEWVSKYGATIRYQGFFGLTRLYTLDTKALNHVLMNSHDYQKPAPARYALTEMLGSGVLVTEGDKHKQQRKVMNPAFGPSHIRELTEIFVDKSLQLRDIWAAEIAELSNGVARIDVLPWLSKMTLDVIGRAGFAYDFGSLNDSLSKPNELNEAFQVLFKLGDRLTVIPVLRSWFPILRFLPGKQDVYIKKAKDTLTRIGRQLLQDTKASIDYTSKSRNLLSLLVQANMSTDLPENQRLSDEDVLAQVPTFLVAGHETTSIGTTWALFALTQDHRVQSKLREELLKVDSDNPTMDQLNSLPYLDMVVRETMRVHAPVPSTLRVAMKDDALPLNEPFTDCKGNVHMSIPVRKGQILMIPILAMNRAKSIWGEDASEFKPERWGSIPEAAGSIPGIWGNMLTFLGGPHACIGFRFSITEMKALLFTLVRAFEFDLAVPFQEIKKKSSIVQRPVLRSDPEFKNTMPLLLRPVTRCDH